jgi:hypothetical protein
LLLCSEEENKKGAEEKKGFQVHFFYISSTFLVRPVMKHY